MCVIMPVRAGPEIIVFIRAEEDRSKIQIMSEEKLKIVPDNFVICDVQREYAECLFRILTERFAGQYQFHLFTDVDRMMEFTEQAGAGVLLVSEGYRAQAERARAQRRFVLTELPCVRESGNSDVIPVFRYQPAERIIREFAPVLYSLPDPERPVKPAAAVKTDARGLIGVYSPVHRIGKTRFALRLGRKLAEEVPVLYLSLEGYSGRSLYFPGEEGEDLGDLLYYLRQERTDCGLKISSMTGQLGQLDYIRPMKNVMDLRDVRKEEWLSLLDTVAEKCIYEAVILDLGDSIDGLYDILERCGRVYTPYISDSVSLAKLKQYEDNLREAGHEDILRHTVKKLMQKKSRHTGKDGG